LGKSNFEIAFELNAKMDSSVQKAFGNASKRLSNLQKNMGDVIKTGSKVSAGLGAAAISTGAALGGVVAKASAAANEINKYSQTAGVSTKSFQQWDHVMKNFGFSMEQASGDFAALGERAMDAANGVGEGAELFDKLGVKVTDASGKMKSQEQIFNETIKSLQGMEDVTERNATASALLGTTGEELAPVLNMTNKELENLKGQANVISSDNLSKADQFREKWNQVSNTFSNAAMNAGIKAMPALQKLMDVGMNNLPAIQDKLSSAMKVAGDAFSWIGSKGKDAFLSTKQAIENNQPTINRLKQIVFDVGNALKNAFQNAKPFLSWLSDTGLPLARDALVSIVNKALDFYDMIKNNWSKIQPFVIGLAIAIGSVKSVMTAMSIVQSVTGFLKAFRAATAASRLAMLGFNTALLANPITWVVAGVAALIGIGILLWKNWDKVSAFFTKMWDKLKSAVAPVGEAIKNAFLKAKDFVVNLFKGIGVWFMQRFYLIRHGVHKVGLYMKKTFQNAWEGIKSIFSGIGSWFSGIFDGVKGSFRGGLNTLISIANRAINKLNGISISIPEWVPKMGGKSFGVNIPNIPHLAEGGITTGATLAMIGEGAEQEAVLPLSKLEGLLNEPGESNSNVYSSNNEDVTFNQYNYYTIEGRADQETIQQTVKMSKRDFEKMLKEVMHNQGRTSFQ